MSEYSVDPRWRVIYAKLEERQAEGWKDLALGLGLAVTPMSGHAQDPAGEPQIGMPAKQHTQELKNAPTKSLEIQKIWQAILGFDAPDHTWHAYIKNAYPIMDFHEQLADRDTGELGPMADKVYANIVLAGILEMFRNNAENQRAYHHLLANSQFEKTIRDSAEKAYEEQAGLME